MTTSVARAAGPRIDSLGRPLGARERAAQATRDAILRAAIKVFAKHGYEGGSVEKISQAAKSVDRMIYYYFGNKEGLFVAVLEETYRRFNDAEAALGIDADDPPAALATVIRFVHRYYREHPEFVSLLNSENLHRGRHIAKSLRAREYSSPAIGMTDLVLRSGIAHGVFRDDVTARDLYLLIAATGYFHQSNRFTLSAFLGEDLESPAALERWEAFVLDIVLRGLMRSTERVPDASEHSDGRGDARRPASKQSESKQSESKQSALKRSALKRPVLKGPGLEEPASKEPISMGSISKRPASKEPVSMGPVSERLASKRPASERLASERLASKRPVSKRPVSKRPVSKRRDGPSSSKGDRHG